MSIKLIEDQFNNSEEKLRETLCVNVNSFTEKDALIHHSRTLKQLCNEYCTASRQFSKALLKNASVAKSSEIVSERHNAFADCQEVINLINTILRENDHESVSEIDNLSVGSSLSSKPDNALTRKIDSDQVGQSVRAKVRHYLENQVLPEDNSNITESLLSSVNSPIDLNMQKLKIIDSVSPNQNSSEDDFMDCNQFSTPNRNQISEECVPDKDFPVRRVSFRSPIASSASSTNSEQQVLPKQYCEDYVETNSRICDFSSSKSKVGSTPDGNKMGSYGNSSNLSYNARTYVPSSDRENIVKSSFIKNENSQQSYNNISAKQSQNVLNQPSITNYAPQSHRSNLPSYQTIPNINPLNRNNPHNDLQAILPKQLLTKDLIKNSIDQFDGSAYKFWSWIQQINNRVEHLNLEPIDYIQVLESNCVGEPKNIIANFMSSCGRIDKIKLREMSDILVERFGSSSRISKELLSKLKESPVIKYPNIDKPLRDLVDLCKLVEFNMRSTPELQFLNIANGAELVREKLPNFLQDKWRVFGQRYEDNNYGQHPPFSELTSFLSNQVREISNSNYKNVTAVKLNNNDKKNFKTYVTSKLNNENQDSNDKTPEDNFNCIIHKSAKHKTANCRTFINMSHSEKEQLIMENKLCFKCLDQHMRKYCKANLKCEVCSKNHCTAMHQVSFKKNTENKNDKEANHEVKSLCTTICNDPSANKNCSKTVLIDVMSQDVPGKVLRCYALIDEMSDCTLMDPKVPEYFNMSVPVENYTISTINGCEVTRSGMLISGITVKGVNENKVISLPPAFTNETIPDSKHEVATPAYVRKIKSIKSYAHNFLPLDKNAETLILIGRNCGDAMKTQCIGDKAPFLHHTSLGWAVVGSACDVSTAYNSKVYRTSISHEHFTVKRTLQMSEADKLSQTKLNVFQEFSDDNVDSLSEEDEQFLQIMNKNVELNENGNIAVPLPFKNDAVMPSNKEAVYQRTSNTLKRLKQCPDKLEQCQQSIKKSLEAGHIEKVPECEQLPEDGSAWWVPIFPVTHPKKKKVRLVYDASAKYSGTSLNDNLLSGPDLNNQLRSVLIKFREGLIGYVSDIQYMFNNFKVSKCHRDYLRFFWFSDTGGGSEIVQYRSTSHIFGCTSSPAVANFCLKYTTRDVDGKELAKRYIQTSFYVDDGLSSANSVEEAVSTLKDAITILSKYNVRLHKILSSSAEVLSEFPESERSDGCHNLKYEEIPSQRTLGILWIANRDVFIIEVNIKDRQFTKRGILSIINSLFDPLGFIAPIVLAGRLIQRKILPPKSKITPELETCGWDDILPDKYLPMWTSWMKSLSDLSSIEIPRCYFPSMSFINAKKELHIFADSSEEAIGFVIYMRTMNNNDEYHVSFVTGGSKVAPQAATSMPRLELCAAVEATVAADNVMKDLNLDISSVMFYSDSRVVLGYIFNKTRRFKKYVSTRVKIILSMSNREQWRYVNSKHNPADISSRPQTPRELSKSMWLKGPSFLWSPLKHEEVESLEHINLPEIQQECTVLKTSLTSSVISSACNRINNWNKMIRVVSLILNIRYHMDCLKQSKGTHLAVRQPIVSPDTAKLCLIKVAQNEVYGDAMEILQQGKHLSESHPLSKLSPFVDQSNILRVGGRLANANMPADNIHPIILPEKHIITKLIVNNLHQQVKHQGRHITLGTVRTNGYHIVHCSKVVRNLIASCVTCKKLRAQTATQLMADLPPDRLAECPPFEHTGIDVFGPYFVYDGKRTRNTTASKKVWVLICTCLVSRAVHLEMLPAMDTSAFRNALTRFIALRGTCKIIRCDIGSNFIGAKNQMQYENFHPDEIKEDLFNKGIQWLFNPPQASHCGGVFERKVASVKKVLEGSLLLLGPRSLSRDELATMLQEAASIVNNTPLWELSSSPDDPSPLTPAALLTLKESPHPVSSEVFTEKDLYSYGKSRWRRVQYISDQFWVRWRRDYLQTLQHRNKWLFKKQSIASGDVVLIRNKSEKRNKWPMARVVDVIKSKDNLIRSVYLKVGNKTFHRSIHDLITLISND